MITGQTQEDLLLQTKEFLFSIIYHHQIQTELMTNDAVWYVGSARNKLERKEFKDYLSRFFIDTPLGIPEIRFSRTDFIGDVDFTVIGEMEYQSRQDSGKILSVSFFLNWCHCEERWEIKHLLTSSKTLEQQNSQEGMDARIDGKSIFETMPVAVVCCQLDDNLTVQMLNKKALRLLGYESIQDYKNAVGSSILTSVHPLDMERFLKYVDDIRNDEEVENTFFRMRCKDHSFIWIQSYAAVVNGKWISFTCLDHTEHHEETQRLKEENKKSAERQYNYHSLINNMPSGFHSCALFEPVHVEYVSDSLCEMTGWTSEEIHGRMNSRYSEMIVPEDRPAFSKMIRSLMQYPHVEQLVYRMVKKDGTIIRVLDKMKSIRQSDGHMWGYSIVVDLDDQMKLSGETVLPEISPATPPSEARMDHTVEINTFGYFEVLVDGQPLAFRSAKARELLAILIDRRGNFVSRETIISLLWENESANNSTMTRCRKTFKNLLDELTEHGIGEILETKNGWRRVIPEKIQCDLFEYDEGAPSARKKFRGVYLAEYPWSEMTLATLLDEVN